MVRGGFERMKDPLRSDRTSLVVHLLVALTMFSFKFPSMPYFDRDPWRPGPVLADAPGAL